jgi:hypothetical protein
MKTNFNASVKIFSREELKTIRGGSGYYGEDCKWDCACPSGGAKEAKLEGCDKGTCDADALGVSCLINGTTTGMGCGTACG